MEKPADVSGSDVCVWGVISGNETSLGILGLWSEDNDLNHSTTKYS